MLNDAVADGAANRNEGDRWRVAAEEMPRTLEQKMPSKAGEKVIGKLQHSRKMTAGMTAVAWSPDGHWLTTAGNSLKVAVWDSQSLALVKELDQDGRGGGRNNIAFSPDGRYLASGLKTVTVWDTSTWGVQKTLIAPHVTPATPQFANIQSLAFSPDGKLLVVAYTGTTRVVIAYRVDDGKIAWSYEPAPTIGNPLLETPLVFTPDGTAVVFATGETRPGLDVDIERLARILFLDAASGVLRKSIDGVHADKPTALAISRDGRWIATGTSTGVIDQHVNRKMGRVSTVENKDPIRVWDASSGKLVSELPVSSRIWGLAFTADARHVIATRSDIQQHMTMGVWESTSGRLVQELKVWPAPMGLALSPDGTRLATTGEGQLSIFELTTKK